MLSSNAAFDSLKSSAFAEDDQTFVNTILYGTIAINADIIQSLRKILEKTTLASDFAVGVKGVTCVLNCLLHICEEDDCFNWEELHLDFVKLLKLCLNFINAVASSSGGMFQSLSSKIMDLISISSEKHTLVKSSIVKVLSQPVIDIVLKKSISVLERRYIVKSFNHILSQSSRFLREQTVKTIHDQLSRLPDILLTCGDYDFQTAIMELIFRFISVKASRQSLSNWFNGYPEIQNAFVDTPFKDFDPECRTFLNLVNSSLGSKQLVFTFPCARAFLGDKEVFKPKDANYREFWVDFSVGSKCVSILCDSCTLANNTEGNVWEVVSIPCTSVKRASLDRGRFGTGVPKGAVSLTLEMGKLHQSDVQEYLLSVKQIKIIFGQSSGLTCLLDKVLPLLFGEVFQDMNSAGKDQMCSSLNLKVPGQKHRSLFKKTPKASTSGVVMVGASGTTSDHLSKYKPLQIVKSPGKCRVNCSQGLRASRTEVAVYQNEEDASLAEPLKPDENLVQESPDPRKDLREILTAHHVEKFNKNPPYTLISPQLSHISEEKSSQTSNTSNVVHESLVCQTSIISGSVAFPPISDVHENLLNTQNDVLNECSKHCEQMKKGKEVTVRCFESASVASCCSKGGEEKYDSAGQRVNPITSHSTGMTPCVHLSRTDKIENKIVKHKFPSSCRMKAAQTSCVTDDLKLCSSEPQQENVNLNTISITTEQQEINKTTFNKEAKTMNHGPSSFISSFKDIIKPSVVRKDMFKQKCYKTNGCMKACGSKEDSTNSKHKFKTSSMITQSERTESSENSLLVNSDLGEDEIVSSIKTSRDRQNELLHKPRELTKDSSKDSAEFKKVKKVKGTEVALIERPKELLHKPEEVTEVSFSDSLQSSVEFQKDKNKKLTARSVPESRSTTQEEKHMGSTKVILSHKTEDRPPEQTTLSDMQNNVHIYSDIIEIRQATVSAVTFRRLCKGTCDLGNVEMSVSKDNFSLISGPQEGKLVSDIKANATEKSKTTLYKHQEQDECLALENTAQNNTEIAEIEQTAKSNISFKGVSRRLHNKHVNSSHSENISLNTSDSAKAGTRNTFTKKVEDFLQKPFKETEISALKNNTQNDSDFIEDKQAASSRKIISRPKRLHNKKQIEVSFSEDCAVDKSGSLEKLKPQTRRDVTASSRGVCNKPQEHIESLETNMQNDSGCMEDDTGASFRNAETLRAHKQKDEMGSCSVNNFDPLVKPIGVRSRTLTKRSQEQIDVLKNNAQHNSTSVEGRKTAYSRNTVDGKVRLINIQQEGLRDCAVNSDLLSKPAVDRLRRRSKPHEEFEALKNNAQNESDFVEDKKTASSKKRAKRSKRLCSKQQEEVISSSVSNFDLLTKPTVDRSIRLCKKPQEEPGIGKEERTVDDQAHSEFSMMLTAGKPHEAGKTVGEVHSKTDASSDHYTKEPYSDRIYSKDSHDSNVLRKNLLSSHVSQKHASSKYRMLASLCDTACASDIQKHLTTTSKDDSSVNSSSHKVDAKISRGISKMESKKNAEKCIQGFCVTRKPNHFSLDSSMLQHLIDEWNSDTERVRSDESSQSDQPSYKDMKSQDLEVITNPSADKIQQVLKDWDSNEADNNHEDLLMGEVAGTNGKNQKLSLNVQPHKHSESPVLSHTVLVDLQNVGENAPKSKNEELKFCENSESKYALNSGSIQELDAPNNVKLHHLKNLYSDPNTGNLKQIEGLTVTKKVPSSETLDQVSKTQDKGIDSIKTPSRKRRLYSMSNSPEVIELENCDDTPLFSSVAITCRSRGRKRNRKSNVSESLTKKPRGGGNRQRRKKEVTSACSEGELLGVTVSSFGGLSQERELDTSKSTQLSVKSFSGRWRNKYLEHATKRKIEKKCKEKVEQPVYNSVYSDIETDSDSDISWMENTKPKRLAFVQKPKITYEKKRRTLFPSKQKMKQVLCPKQLSGQPSLSRKEKSNTRPKIKKSILNKPITEKYISHGKKTSKDPSIETFVTCAVENRLPDVDLFRSNENEQFEEAVPAEINILPCLHGAATSDSRTLPSLIIEAEQSAGSKITPVRKKEQKNDKRVKKRNIKNADKSTDNRKKKSLQYGFNLGSASSDVDASNSQIIASSRNFSELTCMKKFVDHDFIRQEYDSSDKEEVPDCTGNSKMQTNVASEESDKCFYGPLLGAQKRDTGDNDNLYMGRAGSELSDKIVEMHNSHRGTKCNQDVPSTFHSPSNVRLNFTSEQNDKIESPLPAAEVDVCPKSSQNNTGSCSDTSGVGCEDDFEDFCKQFLESSEKEINLYGSLECNNMTVKKNMSESQKIDRNKIHGKKADKLVTNAPFLLGGIRDYDIKDCEEENGPVNVLCPTIELQQPSVRSLPSFCIENANSSNSDLSLSPFNPVCASSFSKGDGQSLSPVIDLSLSKRAEEPISSNIERFMKFREHINDSSFSKRDRQSVSPNIGLPHSERFQKPLGQINDVSVSKRNEQPLSPIIGLPYSKRVQKPLSPHGTKVVPVSPISIPSLPTEADIVNIPVSALSLCKRMAQSNREVSQEDTVPSQLLSRAEDSDKVGVQSFNFLQSAKRVSKSEKKNKENIGRTIVTKQREKCKKTNTSMDLATDGTSSRDGRTMTMQEITGAGDEGLTLAADGVSQVLQLTESSADFIFATATSWTILNPCTTQTGDFMTDFIQNSALMIEDNFRQTYLKGSEKRKLLVADYIQNIESEMEEIESNVEHLSQQEARLQKLENYIKHSFRLQCNYLNDISDSKSHLSNYHHRFNKYWHKLEKEQQALPLVETGRDLKQQLQELIAKKLEEESENDVTRLRVRLQAILRSM